jgi:SsrA-binding protein
MLPEDIMRSLSIQTPSKIVLLVMDGLGGAPYQGRTELDADRDRKLLLHKSEILRLAARVQTKGLTLIPLRVYLRDGRAKVEIGLAKGKQSHDKRATEKDRDWQREKSRVLRARR